MAAGDPIAMTNTLIAALNADQALTLNAADADTADLAQVFKYTPTGKGSKVVFGMQAAATHGSVAYSIAAGTGVFKAAAAKTGSVAQATTDVIQVETGRYLKSGVIEITFTPASGKRLTSDHALKVFALELI